MNKPLLRLLAMPFATLAFLSAAHAQTGTVSVTGTVTNSTCTLPNAGTTAVTLPTVSTNALGAPGSSAGYTPFSLAFTGCGSVAAGTASVYLDGSQLTNTTVDTNTGHLTFGGNVLIRLYNVSNGGTIDLRQGWSGQNPPKVTVAAGANSFTLNLGAEYYATAAATATATKTIGIKYTVVYP